MANNITVAKSGNPIKNGTVLVSCLTTGFPSSGSIVYDRSDSNIPAIGDIENKYDNRFYNGVFVDIVASGAGA